MRVAAARRTTPRWPPVAATAAALGGSALVAAYDPAVPGRYGLCPFLAVTGWWCPLCGSLRAVHELAHTDVPAAASANLLLVLAVPVLIYAWAAWALPRFGVRGPPAPAIRRPVWWALLVVLLAFGLARNLAPFAWLAPELVWAPG